MQQPSSTSSSLPEGGGPFAAVAGFLFGGLIGLFWDLSAHTSPWLMVGSSVFFAVLAYKYGDRFWRWVKENPWW